VIVVAGVIAMVLVLRAFFVVSMALMIVIFVTLVGVLTLLFIGMTRMVFFPGMRRHGLYLSWR
jgi:hypothetical protein